MYFYVQYVDTVILSPGLILLFFPLCLYILKRSLSVENGLPVRGEKTRAFSKEIGVPTQGEKTRRYVFCRKRVASSPMRKNTSVFRS